MIRFGAAGNSQSFYDEGFKHTVETAEWLSKHGLSAFEYSFGRGVSMGESTARNIGEKMAEFDIEISAHAPYYINFASEDEEATKKSIGYVISSVNMLQNLGGKRVVIHSGSQGKQTRESALARIRDGFIKTIEVLEERSNDYILCPEAMGKFSQIGTYKEVVDLCTLSEKMIPCFDFGHINSITGGSLKTSDDFKHIIDYAIDTLGDRAKNIHIHFSKIQYGDKGEIRHLNFDDKKYGPEFEPLGRVLVDYKMSPIVICESAGMQAEDALYMKNIYNSML